MNTYAIEHFRVSLHEQNEIHKQLPLSFLPLQISVRGRIFRKSKILGADQKVRLIPTKLPPALLPPVIFESKSATWCALSEYQTTLQDDFLITELQLISTLKITVFHNFGLPRPSREPKRSRPWAIVRWNPQSLPFLAM